jgi:hypothetical protein
MTIQEGSWEKSDNLVSYFKPIEGVNIFRVVGDPVTTFTHWVKTNLSSRVQKYSCAGKNNCPICNAGVDLLIRNCFLIYDRASQSVKIYEAPNEVFKNIKAYAADEDYGDVTKYDFKLTRSGQGLLTQYQVTPKRKQEPLTDEEMVKVTEAKKTVDWKKLYPSRTCEELEQVVENFTDEFKLEVEKKQAEKAQRKLEKAGASQATPAKTVAATAKPKASTAEDDSDFFDKSAESDDFDLNNLNWED